MIGRFLVPIGILILVIGGGVWIMSLLSYSRKRKRAMQAAIDDNAVMHPRESQAHVNLYMNMVAKHGPDSEEATAFRFGTGGSLGKQLFSSDAIRDAFELQANIIDDTYRMMKKGKNDSITG